MENKVTKIGVLTSGGDAPGMNAAIRAVVRTGIYYGMEVFGIMRGYSGMIENDIIPMHSRSVANIIQRGGTILKTARCKEFFEHEGRQKAYSNLKKLGINGLVIIGGDGSFRGAHKLSTEFDMPCIGLPGTIDKDIAGTDFTIGFDTAINNAVEAIDKIRDTAAAHERLFLVEVMGRHCGYLALMAGIAAGAEAVVIPEVETDPEAVADQLHQAYQRGKSHAIVVVAEGAHCTVDALTEHFSQHAQRLGFEVRVTKLGHIQRGGTPAVFDRLSGTQLGAAAVEHLNSGRHGVLLGIVNGALSATPLSAVGGHRKPIDPHWIELAHELAL